MVLGLGFSELPVQFLDGGIEGGLLLGSRDCRFSPGLFEGTQDDLLLLLCRLNRAFVLATRPFFFASAP